MRVEDLDVSFLKIQNLAVKFYSGYRSFFRRLFFYAVQ